MKTQFITATVFLALTSSVVMGQNDETTTIALTTTIDIPAPEPAAGPRLPANEREEQERAEQARTEKERAEALLALLEAEATLQPGISVVERRHIELALHELMLNGGAANDDRKLQMGKLATADLIVSVKLVKAADDELMKAFIRVTEPLTGVIRGATVVKIGNVDIADAAEQIVRYTNAVIHNPRAAGVTVSIAPFESEGKFDHVLPLELMVRNVLTEQIRQAGDFQVLQRTDMSSLLDELDLVLSGFVDKKDLPETLPSREGAYHIDGTVDERIDKDNVVHMIVNARLVQTATAKVVLSQKREFVREDLAGTLRSVSTEFVKALQQGRIRTSAPDTQESNEAQRLCDLAIRDARRFSRRGFSGSSRSVALRPHERLPDRPRVRAESALGMHLFKKTIDRLETVLFLQPENQSAQLALAYCYSFNVPGIWNPTRSNELYRKIIAVDKTTPLATAAYRDLMMMYVNHSDGYSIAPESISAMIEQVNFVLKDAPRDAPIGYFLQKRRLRDLFVRTGDFSGMMKTTLLAWKRVEREDRQKSTYKPHAKEVAKALKEILTNSETPAEVKQEAQELLKKWLVHPDPIFRTSALDNLPTLAHSKQEVEEIRVAYAAKVKSMDGQLEWLSKRLLETAAYFLESNRPDEALNLLKKFNADKVWTTNSCPKRAGCRDYYKLLGEVYEALNQPQLARDTYLKLAELRHSFHIDPVIESRIDRLGGVPLRPDSDISVRHHSYPGGHHSQAMVTDGEYLYCGKLSYGTPPGIWVFDLRTKKWRDFEKVPHHARCLVIHNGSLWVGTDEQGIWKVDIASGQTTQFTKSDGLPANNVLSIVATAEDVYAHVNAKGISSGGIVHINAEGAVRYLAGEKDFKPSNLIVVDGRPLIVANSYIHEWSETDSKWNRYSERRVYGKLFYANGRLWDAGYKRSRTFCLQEIEPGNREYIRPLSHASGTSKPNFLFDGGDYLWVAGRAWDFFRSHGLFRIHKETGEFDLYGPRDGFSIRGFCDFTCQAGVYAQGRMWFAMTNGIAEVEILPAGDKPRKKKQNPAEERHQLLLETVADLDVREERGWQLWLNRDPVLRHQVAGQRFRHTECFLYNDRYGIPRAVAVAGLREKGDLYLEVTSLSDGPIKGSLPHVPRWRPGYGGSGRRLAKVQPQGIDRDPGDMMRVIARSLRVEVGTRQWHRNALNPQPTFGYAAARDGVLHGAIFAYGPEDDPNVFVNIWQETEDQKWYWLAAPATTQRIRCSEKGEVVWQKDRYWAKQPTAEDGYREFKLTNHADLIESPELTSAQK